MKILIVDDSFAIRKIISNTLKQEGYKDLIEAKDGKDALQKMGGVDLLITDWNMPEMNGLELIQAVRVHPSYKDIPIMMVTTEGAKKDVAKAIMAGVNDYIVKPFQVDLLKEKVRKMLEK